MPLLILIDIADWSKITNQKKRKEIAPIPPAEIINNTDIEQMSKESGIPKKQIREALRSSAQSKRLDTIWQQKKPLHAKCLELLRLIGSSSADEVAVIIRYVAKAIYRRPEHLVIEARKKSGEHYLIKFLSDASAQYENFETLLSTERALFRKNLKAED